MSAMIELETPRLLLRKARLADAKDIFEYSQNPKVAQYVLWDAHRSVQESKNYIRYLIRQTRQGRPSSYVIEHKHHRKVIGTIGFMWIQPEYASGEVGYSLSEAYWNQGYMTEALAAIIKYGFVHLGLNRIEGQHDVRNRASGSVMKRVGMKKEGTMRNRMVNKGEFIDLDIYAILRKDWEITFKKGEI